MVQGFEREKSDDTSFEVFKDMMRSPSTDDWWFLSTNFRKVEIGDRIWCYYGQADGDAGIVGLATIPEIRHDDKEGTHDVHLKWNRSATRRLIAHPVPAHVVRRFVQRPRASVTALNPHRSLLRRLIAAAGLK
jgi:predicted RNA-binding protein with PUA-like domain